MPKTRIDLWLLIPVILLITMGLFVLRSIAPDQLLPQILFLLVSMVAFFALALTDFRIIFSFHFPLYLLSLGLLALPFLVGSQTRGVLRWFQLGQFSVQPAEIIKPFLLITFAMLAIGNPARKYFFLTLAFLIPAVVIFIQPDLGTTLVLGVGWVTILISKIPAKVLLTSFLLGVLVIPVCWYALKPYQRQRLYAFANPYSDPLGAGYHVIQSITAVGSGQFLGRGLGQGTQSQLRFLPEHYTDFIFASLSEELGFTGSVIILTLYAWFLWRIYQISQTTSVPAAAHYCLGVLSLLAFQIFVNIGMNMGLAPVTGITLPFLSYGGSSLLSLGLTLGLLSSISRHSNPNSSFQIR